MRRCHLRFPGALGPGTLFIASGEFAFDSSSSRGAVLDLCSCFLATSSFGLSQSVRLWLLQVLTLFTGAPSPNARHNQGVP